MLNAASAASAQVAAAYGQLPLSFEANEGQLDPQVRFLARGNGYSLFLTPTQAVLTLQQPPVPGSQPPAAVVSPETVLRMHLIGANHDPPVVGEDRLPGMSNYLIGNDPSQWHTAIPTYGKVAYHGVYPGIDLVYYGDQRQLEYDFTVAPGADPAAITLAFQGADNLSLDGQGDLVLHTPSGDVVEHAPVLYQEGITGQEAVFGRYVLEGADQAGFEVGPYDHSRRLIMDPVLSYSTYLGGSSTDRGFGIAVDGSGNAYLTGDTFSTNFPTTAGAFQTTNRGLFDAFVTKLNAAGTGLVYSTYLGGSNDDAGAAIAVDPAGNAYVAGVTGSTNFPTTPGAFQRTKGGGPLIVNAFVAKLNAGGTGLVYSTYLGGSGDFYGDAGISIAVDAVGHAYVTGDTDSTNFPTTPGAFQRTKGGGASTFNAFVTKLNAGGTALLYSTYLGGSRGDEGYAIAVDPAGSAYVTGYAGSTNFPTTPGAFQTTLRGVINAFVTKLNPSGTAVLYSTYLGGSGNDQGNGIAVDGSGNAFVTGYASSTNFPTTPGAFQTTNHAPGHANAFVTKLNAGGTALLYSTYLGGTNGDEGHAIAVDGSSNAYVTGQTASTDFPTTPGAFQTTNHSRYWNAFVTKLNAVGTALHYSTYLGGSNADGAYAIAVDGSGNAYVTGYADSGDFPTTPGAFQAALRGSENAFMAKFDMIASLTVTAPPSPVTAGVPFAVTVTALLGNNATATSYRGTVHFTSSDPAATLPADYTFTAADNGAHTFTVTLNTTGSQSLTVTDTADSSMSNQAVMTTEFAVLTPNSDPASIANGPDGKLWFTENVGNRIGRITLDGGVTEFQGLTANSSPIVIATGPDGNLWLTEYTGNRIGRITPTGVLTEFPIPTGGANPYGITSGPDGNLWFTELGANRIGQITPNGVLGHEFPLPNSGSGPDQITAGPDGALWFTEYYGNRIGRIAPDGGISEFPVPTPNSGPFGIALGPDSNLWFTESSAAGNKIGRITPDGIISEFPLPVPTSSPIGIAAGPDGNLWFTENAGNRIGRITLAGVLQPDIPVSTPNGNPGGIVTGPDGNVWFTERTANRIGRFTLAVPVAPAAADHFVLTAPTSVPAGTPFDLTVAALDPYGNIDTNYQGTVTFSSTDGSAALPPDYTFTTGLGSDNGVHTFSGGVTLFTAGDQMVIATDTSTPTISGSATMTVTPALADDSGRPGLAAPPLPAVSVPRDRDGTSLAPCVPPEAAMIAPDQALADCWHPPMIDALNKLADHVQARGDSEEAEQLHREAFAIAQFRRETYPHLYQQTLAKLTALLRKQGRDQEADDVLQASKSPGN
jgi:streptogramin lyase